MFSLHDFVMKGLKEAIGKLEDYQVVLNAAGWFDKGVLSKEDLAEINQMIEAREQLIITE